MLVAVLVRALVESYADRRRGALARGPAPDGGAGVPRATASPVDLVHPVSARAGAAPRGLRRVAWAGWRAQLEETGERRFVEDGFERLLARGNGAVRQRRRFEETHDLAPSSTTWPTPPRPTWLADSGAAQARDGGSRSTGGGCERLRVGRQGELEAAADAVGVVADRDGAAVALDDPLGRWPGRGRCPCSLLRSARWKRSKTRSRCSGGMPMPLSRTITRAQPSSTCSASIRTRGTVPGSTYLKALPIRLSSTWRRSTRSAQTSSSSPATISPPPWRAVAGVGDVLDHVAQRRPARS